jgi:hypothetical protein
MIQGFKSKRRGRISFGSYPASGGMNPIYIIGSSPKELKMIPGFKDSRGRGFK